MRMVLKDGKRKVFTLSYDDGVVTDGRMMEIMNKYGIKGTFNINTGIYAEGDMDPEHPRGHMTKASAIKLFKDSGHEVAVHGYKHLRLDTLDSIEILHEILEDKRNIEEDYGIIARGMAYAYGRYNEEVLDILKKCQIAYARGGNVSHKFDFPENWLALQPTCHHKDEKLMELARTFVEEEDRRGWCRMFYVYGHSFEFAIDDNWHVLEGLLEYVGGREDIWYATNIEIYDYVEAYKRLQTNYEKTRVHNPSAIPVWIEIGETAATRGQVYCVEPGQTLVLKD